MTPDALVCPWSQTPLPTRTAPAAVSFAVLAVTGGVPAHSRTSEGDALACPWSGTALPALRSLPVPALPSLAPALPAPRTAAPALQPATV